MQPIKTYKDYVRALKESPTEMFWVIPDDVIVSPDFKFDIYFTHDNEYDRKINHVFLNGEHYDGLMLMSKHCPVSEREFKHRFLINRKEWPLQLSKPKLKLFDIVFISYNEPNAGDNFSAIQRRYPDVKRVHGVKGIHNAHIKAAELSETSLFWVIDGDAIILDDFHFNYHVPAWDKETVHVWRSKNPINNLEYGYGGVKLLPRELTLNVDTTSTDMTTSISTKFKAMPKVSNITAFNTDPFNTWKSAFRECAKLSSKVINRQKSDETLNRLNIWKTVGSDAPYGSYAIAGAIAGADFAIKNPDSVILINDFDWLYKKFLEHTE